LSAAVACDVPLFLVLVLVKSAYLVENLWRKKHSREKQTPSPAPQFLMLSLSKGKKSDLETALTGSPAEFQKAAKTGGEKVDTVEKALASFLTRLEAIRSPALTRSSMPPRRRLPRLASMATW
jgi:hypothetical protein